MGVKTKKLILVSLSVLIGISVFGLVNVAQASFSWESNLVAHYKMNDNDPNSTTVVDSEDYSNGTAQQNTSVLYDVDGKVNSALKFNGTTDYIDTNNTFQSVFQSDFSINLWVKVTDGSIGTSQELGIADYTHQNVMLFGVVAGGRLFGEYVSNNLGITAVESTASFVNDQNDWKMITLVATQVTTTTGNIALYVNSSLVNQGTIKSIVFGDFTSVLNLFFGARNRYGNAASFLGGSIDNVMIFNEALSPDEITELYNSGNGIEDFTPPSLSEVTPVPSPTNDSSPEYTFNSSEAGAIAYGGLCSSTTANAIAGDNTITFNELSQGTYNDCTITVTDEADNESDPLPISEFTIIYMEGSGTPEDPYQITNCIDLQAMQGTLNSHYILNNDIYCSDTINWDGELGFNPIGDGSTPFTGSFDGDNHKITNLFINRTSENYVGLFGIASSSSSITNIGLVDTNISSGGNSIGGLIGYMISGTISNSYTTGIVSGNYTVGGLVGTISSGTISNSYSASSVSGNYTVGGLVGQCNGSISNSYSTGNVLGSDSIDGFNIGGLVGMLVGTVSNSYSVGNVSGKDWVGGLVGDNNGGTISTSYSTGNVSGHVAVGGLVGFNEMAASISNSYSTGNVSGDTNVGGFIGENIWGTISNSYSTGNVSGDEVVGGLVGRFVENASSISYSYWFDWPGDDATDCYSNDNTDCTKINDNVNYFYSISNPPMDLWDFASIWGAWFDGINYPPLLWQDITAPTCSIPSITVGSSSQITITATATDTESGVSTYYFDRDSGTANSDWQTPPDWTDTGLSPNTRYTYQVKARDAAGNESSYSTATSTYTLSPTPTNLTATAGSGSITLTVDSFPNSSSGSSGYYFSNTTKGTNYSGWLTTNFWQDTGLSCGASYTYSVKYRNGDAVPTDIIFLTQSTNGCGGGGLPSAAYNPPTSPAGGFGISINNDAPKTNSHIVTLNLKAGSDTERMAISNFPNFLDASQETYASTKTWNLCQGLSSCPESEYKVYAKFYTSWGRASEAVFDSIIYFKEIAQKPLIERLPEILQPFIPEFLKPKPLEVKPPEVPIEELMPKEAPLVFQAKWQLLPPKPIREFVLAPLPKEIRNLAEKFPELGETLKKVGITKVTDIEKLKTVKLTLPGLTERVGPEGVGFEPTLRGKLALPKGLPIAKLSPQMKQWLPTEIVFAKTGGQLIDFNIALSITEKGEPQQKITTISDKPLQLMVKPDKPIKNVKGYVIFKSKKPRESSFQFPLNSLAASLIFANPVFVKVQEKPVKVVSDSTSSETRREEKLVLLEFEYTDPDGDGIYTAEIQAPLVDGEYEIITVIDYVSDPTVVDPEGRPLEIKKEIRLITVVDPEGYIYEKEGDKETRIPGAIVSLFWLNPETKQYELWPAKEYQQENPQTTDVRGTYSFLVPEGFYYLRVEAPGYLFYDGKPFQIKEGSGVHVNIELKTKYWWFKIIDWKTILLIIVILLLLYNFYRDKIRDRIKNQ